MGNRRALGVLLAGLVASGVAGIVNQVVWQRALKLFLGGSETLSAMVVVLVFLAGLGAGAALAGRRAGRLSNPLLALAAVELALAAVNLAVAVVLALDLSESVYAAQRVAASFGLPRRAVYAVASTVLLAVPTLLMGATVPFASEACQRQLKATSTALVPVLFFVNTVGAAAGALAASLVLLPWVGQRASLVAAVVCNALAGVALAALARGGAVDPRPEDATASRRPLSREEGLGFVLGFLALSYEMLLFRALSLSHWPLPATFALGLAGFLVAWSLGVALAGRLPENTGLVAFLTAVSMAMLPEWVDLNLLTDGLSLGTTVAITCVPCVGFGLLYGQLVSRRAEDWGRDVGRYAALNTLGSCLGVLGFTLVGLEAPLWHGAVALALGMGAVATIEGLTGRAQWTAAGVGAVGLAVLATGLVTPVTTLHGATQWWGRDGVVEVNPEGNVYIDGLWHTKLTDGRDHVGRPYSWLMAMAAVVAHEEPPSRALVIGAGVGITSATLAGVPGLQIDGYEINRTLRRVLEALPDQTLDALNQPQIRWIWDDARTGLALSEDTYDLILSAPLHLRQAGSSQLLSVEYLRLVKARLNEGGVVAVYANEGEPAQALLVQRTLAEAFAYRVSWYDGLVTVASDQPITVTEALLEGWMQRDGQLALEMRRLDAERRAAGQGGLFALYDGPQALEQVASRPITDDWPLLEYPQLAERWVEAVPTSAVSR